MSYVLPAVLVYEQLAQSGGVANVTPDLKACIIGPCYNVVSYIPGSIPSLIETSALSALTATGSTVSGSNIITFTVQAPFTIGDTLLIPGADASGSTLSTKVTDVSGYTVTVDTVPGTTVTDVVITKVGVIVDNSITNTFSIPEQKPGQVVDTSSLQVYLNNAKIETLATTFTSVSGSSVLTMAAASSPADATSGSTSLTGVTKAILFTIGDPVIVSGAGIGGADLHTTITDIVGQTVSVQTAPGTTNASATITKDVISNVNSVTSTLKIEAGDSVELFYTNNLGAASTFTSEVISVVNLTGTITDINITDMLPTNLSIVTTASAAASSGASSITVTSATGLNIGDQIVISGGAAGGGDLYTTIGAIATNVLSGLSPALGADVSIGANVTRVTTVTVRSRKLYNNQLLPITLNSFTNYNDSSVATTGNIDILPECKIVYGTVVTASVNIAYRALRLDLSGSVQDIADPNDIVGTLGAPSDKNPLALGVQLAMANTTTEISCIAIQSDDLIGYQEALALAENATLYALVPLTQDIATLALFQQHVIQMSTPQMAAWRMALVNSAIPIAQNIGPYSSTLVNSNSGNNTITQLSGKYVLTASNATFVSDGVVPGDIVNITAGTGTPNPIGTAEVLNVINNQQISVQALGTATGVSYYVSRNLTKAQQAADVAAQSTTYGVNRVVNVMPDLCGITVNGSVMNLPGYYLCCTIAGLIAGFPVQQGFTNIAVAGISNLSHSNFYFTRAQMDSMAAAGTLLFVQESQASTPYIRHQLTTDMTVLQYRELSLVKNIDFLAYFYVQILKGFIGRWNITPDSLNTLRQTVNAGSALLEGQKLPKIGPPLISASITTLKQDPNNKDHVILVLNTEYGIPLNYVDLYLMV